MAKLLPLFVLLLSVSVFAQTTITKGLQETYHIALCAFCETIQNRIVFKADKAITAKYRPIGWISSRTRPCP